MFKNMSDKNIFKNGVSLENFEENFKNRLILKQYCIINSKAYEISTVDLLIDTDIFGRGYYWETIIFNANTWKTCYLDRYNSEKEAILAHNKLCDLAENYPEEFSKLLYDEE